MAMDIAILARCFNRVVSLLNLSDEDDPYNATITEFGEFTAGEITDAIYEGEVAFVEAILSNPKHPFRNRFILTGPTALDSGDKVPEYLGESDKVEVRVDSTNYKLGIQLRNLSRFHAIVDNTEIVAAVKRRYYIIQHGRAYTAAEKIRVYAPTYNAQRAGSPALQVPAQCERGVICFAIGGLWKGTTEQSVHDFYMKQAAAMLAMTADGQTMLPKIEQFRRRDG